MISWSFLLPTSLPKVRKVCNFSMVRVCFSYRAGLPFPHLFAKSHGKGFYCIFQLVKAFGMVSCYVLPSTCLLKVRTFYSTLQFPTEMGCTASSYTGLFFDLFFPLYKSLDHLSIMLIFPLKVFELHTLGIAQHVTHARKPMAAALCMQL